MHKYLALDNYGIKGVLKMALYVRIENNEVKDVWDTPPAEGVGNNGWKNAIEIRPNIIPGRQGYTAHTFDLTKDPVQIVYGTFEFTVDERKAGLKAHAMFDFKRVADEQLQNPTTFNPAVIAAAKSEYEAKIAKIDAATSHDELDAI